MTNIGYRSTYFLDLLSKIEASDNHTVVSTLQMFHANRLTLEEALATCVVGLLDALDKERDDLPKVP